MRVCEIFTSIQGESSYAGVPCTFVRMTGCNLRCSYCDTQYAYTEGSERSGEDILRKIYHTGIRLVEITGGEPLLQSDVYLFVRKLAETGYKVLVETNGSLSIKDMDSRAVVILDIKTPGSGMSEKMDLSNLDIVKQTDEVKFVITDGADYEWSKELIQGYNLLNKCKVLLSPAYGLLYPEDLARWMIADHLQARLNLQLQKYIFGPERRGV